MSRRPRYDPHRSLPGSTESERSALLRRWSLDLVSPRGWLLTGFALLCLLLAQLLGRHELMALGCALLALVVGAWLLVRLGTNAAGLSRTLPAEPVSVGDVVEVSLHCPEPGSVREVLPRGYPSAPVFQSPGTFDYELVFRQRGLHRLGPAQQVVSDPCGLMDGMVDTEATDYLAVRAQSHRLENYSTVGERMLTGEAWHTHNAEVDHYDVGIREHQQGDSMRQVHWKASARHGKLMVRQENYVATAHSLIVLDRRLGAWQTPADRALEIPQGAQPPLRSTQRFENALSLACSIAELYANHGYQLLVQDTSGLGLGNHRAPGLSASAARDRFEDFHGATATLELVPEPPSLERGEIFGQALHRTLLDFADEPVFLVLGELTADQARWLAGLSSTVRNVDLFVLGAHRQKLRELEPHFAPTPWRVHAPAVNQSVPQIWGQR